MIYEDEMIALEERIEFLIKADAEMTELYMRIQTERDELVDETIELREELLSLRLTIEFYEQDRLRRGE